VEGDRAVVSVIEHATVALVVAAVVGRLQPFGDRAPLLKDFLEFNFAPVDRRQVRRGLLRRIQAGQLVPGLGRGGLAGRHLRGQPGIGQPIDEQSQLHEAGQDTNPAKDGQRPTPPAGRRRRALLEAPAHQEQ
jgi:hypothetical protein